MDYLNQKPVNVLPLHSAGVPADKIFGAQRLELERRAAFVRSVLVGEKKLDPVLAWHLGVGQGS